MKTIGCLSLLALWALAGCVPKATVVRETSTNRIGPAHQGEGEIRIQPQTRVLDARSALLFSTGHIPGAINVRWSDFAASGSRNKGLLDKDHSSLARRLARLGIGPDTHVVVVGQGLAGAGEEGRLAWMLTFLGVKHVQIAALDYFQAHLTPGESPPPENAPLWEPVLRSEMVVTRNELLAQLKPLVGRQVNESSRAMEANPVVVIDARSEREYLGVQPGVTPLPRKRTRGKHTKTPPAMQLNSINMEWVHFFSPDGRVNPQILKDLRDVGIVPQQRVIVVDQGGVRACAVAFALVNQGYSHAGCFPGGFEDLR